MDGFRVDVTTLGAHAGDVDRLAERMRRASRAGAPLGLHAYGLVGQVFAVAADAAARTASQAVARLADAAQGHGDGVRATARGYLDAERGAATTFGTGREAGR